MFFRKLGFIAFCTVLVLYVVHDPKGAADSCKEIAGGLSALADGLSTFLRFLR